MKAKLTKEEQKNESTTLGDLFLKELVAEVPASRKCIERVPEKLFAWKPHERSMEMGYLAELVAQIPQWVATMAQASEIDMAVGERGELKTTADLVALFEKNIEAARNALRDVSNDALTETFYLKRHGQVVFEAPKSEFIPSTINHLVHHRGQLSVYLRMNDIAVPSIYGPSADEQSF